MKNPNDIKLEHLLKFDALDTAEKLFGKGTDEANASGFILLQKKSEILKNILKSNNDTFYNQEANDYIKVIESIGFSKYYSESFIKDNTNRNYYIYWHTDGILLSFDTFRWNNKDKETINSSNIYFNWCRTVPGWGVEGLSGGISKRVLDKNIYTGSMDAREALVHKINNMKQKGYFYSDWVEQPFLYLVHSGEQDKDYKISNEEKINQLPDFIKNSITAYNPWTI